MNATLRQLNIIYYYDGKARRITGVRNFYLSAKFNKLFLTGTL
jgi:hypothetical protein